MQLTKEVTHFLESRGETLSANSKCSSPQKPLTCWRGENQGHQQGPNAAQHGSHSLTGEPRRGLVSRVQMQLTSEATHELD